MKNKKVLILYSIIILLGLTYALSFVSSGDKRKAIKTALVNKKNLSLINEIYFEQNDSSLTLQKRNGTWFVEDLPADNTRIENFLDNLTQIRTVYKITDTISKKNNYGLNDGSQFIVKYFYNDNDSAELIFGNSAFSNTERYFMNGKTAAVYEVDSSLDVYLSLKKQYWQEPYIISQNVLGNVKAEDIQSISITYENKVSEKNSSNPNWNEAVSKLLDLRHGGEPASEEFSKPVMILGLELGNKNIIKLTIKEAIENNQEYLVIVNYYDNATKVSTTTNSKISLWTYNKIKEIML